MVMLSEIVVGAFLCIVISQVPGPIQADPNNPATEELQDEYYTVIPAMTNQFVPQDEIDAKAIYDSKNIKTTIASILSRREKVRRYAINIKMSPYTWDKERWFRESYAVGENPFKNFCFALIEKEATALGSYLRVFMENKDIRWIGLGMVLTKDTHDLLTTFDSHYTDKFDSFLNNLGDPYKTMVKNWASKNREPLEKDVLNHESVIKDANTLNTEHNNGGWKATRTQLDSIFFQKSIKYARAVMLEFEKLHNGQAIEEIISSDELDVGLIGTYRTFAQYIKDKHKFIAGILFLHSDGIDNWTTWIMCMAVIHHDEWPKVDAVFKHYNKGSLTKFITEKNDDKIMAEMMAVIIDPSFKPTQF